jgi:hypothetical protein
MPPPAPAPAVPVAVPLPVPDLVPESRPVWPPDRRDWLMLAAGGLGVLAAVGVGYGFARLVRGKPPEPEGEQKE